MAKKKNKTQTKKKAPALKLQEWQREADKDIKESEQEVNVEIPQQAEFFKTPVRFGNIPVDQLPMGCDPKEQYRKLYPKISLPFQTTERVSFGHKELEPNQLIFGDNLHVMRALPSNSIDLIYIDPPFFSGRNYNIVFGDQNEVRSFTDIWEGGMPGYLTWLNARLLEMKRLLKPTGSILVHLDYHAGHYVKVELDKIFGYENFRNEIVWHYFMGGKASTFFGRKHDVILWYSKGKDWTFNKMQKKRRLDFKPSLPATSSTGKKIEDKTGKDEFGYFSIVSMDDVWDIRGVFNMGKEYMGYPTQKPEVLLERFLTALSKPGDIVADFFCGGGTTPAVAQKLGRRWIASDISKIAVSVTRDRLLRDILGEDGKTVQQSITKVPDIEVSHWGVYEVPELIKLDEDSFRNFIISAYNGRLTSTKGLIHGYKQAIPLFVGNPSQEKPVTEKEVAEFAKYIIKTGNYHQGTMLAWGFTPGARNVAQQLAAQHAIAIDFVKLQLIPIESKEFKEHITSKHQEYRNLLKFILPPEVRISHKRIKEFEYEFDVSESVSLNPSGKIINVQWDFSYNGERFISTPGYSFLGMKNNKPVLKINYKFPSSGKKKIACKVQDDEGGEKIEIFEVNVK